MWIKSPRWLLIVEALLLVAALLVLAYKAAMWVRPLGRVDQAQFLKKKDALSQVHEYYRDSPASYIRIGKESWKYLQSTSMAVHGFTLTSTATVPYREIRVRLTYQAAAGAVVKSEVVTVPGTLAAGGALRVAGLEVHHVPPESESVVARVEGAVVAGTADRQPPAEDARDKTR